MYLDYQDFGCPPYILPPGCAPHSPPPIPGPAREGGWPSMAVCCWTPPWLWSTLASCSVGLGQAPTSLSPCEMATAASRSMRLRLKFCSELGGLCGTEMGLRQPGRGAQQRGPGRAPREERAEERGWRCGEPPPVWFIIPGAKSGGHSSAGHRVAMS